MRGYKRALDPRRRTPTRFRGYSAAGRWLLYVEQRSKTSRLLRRDARSGITSKLASGRRVGDLGPRILLSNGTVVFLARAGSSSGTRQRVRRLLVSRQGESTTELATGDDIHSIAATLRADGRPVVYWMAADGSHSSGVTDRSPPAPKPVTAPPPTPQSPPCEPAGSRTIFANGRVHVLQLGTADAVACDTATGITRPLRTSEPANGNDHAVFSDFRSNGTWLIYQEGRDRGPGIPPLGSLEQLDVATGAHRRLEDLVFYQRIGFADLLADGSAVWQLMSSPHGPGTYQSIIVQPHGAPQSSLIDSGVKGPGSTPADDIAFRSLALAPDGSAYWRRGDNAVRMTNLVVP